jgi:hypothetical protein
MSIVKRAGLGLLLSLLVAVGVSLSAPPTVYAVSCTPSCWREERIEKDFCCQWVERGTCYRNYDCTTGCRDWHRVTPAQCWCPSF